MIARAGGDLNREPVSAALRSCYPDLIVKKKAAASVEEVFLVEDVDDSSQLESRFADVTSLLEDHLSSEPSRRVRRIFLRPMWPRFSPLLGVKSVRN